METSARDRSELGRIRRSRRRVTMSFGRPLKLSFGLGDVVGLWGGGGIGGAVWDPARGLRPPWATPLSGLLTGMGASERPPRGVWRGGASAGGRPSGAGSSEATRGGRRGGASESCWVGGWGEGSGNGAGDGNGTASLRRAGPATPLEGKGPGGELGSGRRSRSVRDGGLRVEVGVWRRAAGCRMLGVG
jgi:hypothetical protein